MKQGSAEREPETARLIFDSNIDAGGSTTAFGGAPLEVLVEATVLEQSDDGLEVALRWTNPRVDGSWAAQPRRGTPLGAFAATGLRTIFSAAGEAQVRSSGTAGWTASS